MNNREIAAVFEETADLLELQGANSFRVRAYRNAAQTVADLVEPIASLAESGAAPLTDLPGIGKDIASKIESLVHTGTFPMLEELHAAFPRSLLQLLRLPGLGPKKAARLHQELGIQSLDDLKAAAEAGRIAPLKGFGKKTEQTILAGLQQVEQIGQRYSIAPARLAAETLLADLRSLPVVSRAEVAGSCRRRRESCADLDLLAISSDSEAVMERLAAHPLVAEVLSRGETKQRVRLRSGLELDLRVVPAESFGAALQYFTGSKDHNIVIRRRAQERGLKLNEYGLYRGDDLVAGKTEEEVYAAVGLKWIPPELRENRGEIELAEQDRLPELLTIGDIQGDLHLHTTASDGTATIRQMILAARERGLKYIAVTDHSQRVSMANGLSPERLRAHWQEIRRVREEFDDIHVLCGIECDILENAELDLPDDVLAEAEWVLAVLHYGLKQPKEQIMKRLLNAIHNPYVCAIGHPSGRLVTRRAPADIDFPEIFQAAAEQGVMMEINAHPERLDLDDLQAAAAKAYGIPIVINTDAHSPEGYDVLEYGVDQARRAGLTRRDVANALPFDEFMQLLQQRRR
ncbi:DNA polymerase/3'-5' exonuclease PolX [Planctomicrobium sp. SH664]|uniref:DNA polymerase/3'-5' exonuclease PolX n=1 Tax=Planctomicrobium sp. SH664 TaxID=3448125 RepID=UPI003F5B43AA